MWLVLAVLSAIFQSTTDVLSKRCTKNTSEYLTAWGIVFFSFLTLLPVLYFIEIPQLGSLFWPTVIFVCFLDAVSLAICLKAIKYSDLSLILPLQMFTPLFLLGTSPLMIGEVPSGLGLFGVILIVFGSYTLNITSTQYGLLEPFRALFNDKGAKLMLIVAATWSITTNLHKVAVVESSALFYSVVHQAAVALFLFPIVLLKVKKPWKEIKEKSAALFTIGLSSSVIVVCVMLAMTSGLVVYVFAVKRTSVLLSMFLGSLLFKEGNLRQRLAGAGIMILGVALTTV